MDKRQLTISESEGQIQVTIVRNIMEKVISCGSSIKQQPFRTVRVEAERSLLLSKFEYVSIVKGLTSSRSADI